MIITITIMIVIVMKIILTNITTIKLMIMNMMLIGVGGEDPAAGDRGHAAPASPHDLTCQHHRQHHRRHHRRRQLRGRRAV